MTYEGEDRRDPERFVFPKWFMPVVTGTILALGGIAYTAHNQIIVHTQLIDYLQKSVHELREENRDLRAEFERQKEKNVRSNLELLEGIDELLMRKRRRDQSGK